MRIREPLKDLSSVVTFTGVEPFIQDYHCGLQDYLCGLTNDPGLHPHHCDLVSI